MSFSIQLTPDVAGVEPGATVTLSVIVVNKADEQDRFEMDIEGIDSEWKAVPVPVFAVDQGETHSEKIFFKPRRDSESLAGNYPFVVRVRSLNSGDQRTAQGVLQVKAFHHLTMEISPKKGFIGPLRQANNFEVSLMNLGNSEHTIQLLGSDPEDMCAYEFENDQISVGPGQQRNVELTIDPLQRPLFSGGRLIGFTVTGRCIDAPSIVTSSQAQLEQRALLSPTSLIVMVFLAILLGAWILLWPKPPGLTFSANPRDVTEGDPIQLQWVAERSSRVTIKAGDDVIYDGPELTKSLSYPAKGTGTLEFDAIASKDGRKVEETVTVRVEPAPPVIPPQITRIGADPQRVKFGESFILHYGFNEGVTKAVLAPLGTALDLNVNDQQITPSQAGDTTYTVVATNSKGDSAKKSITIHVYDESDAKILAFDASPTSVDPMNAKTHVTWQVTGSVRVELKEDGGAPTPVDASGAQDIPIAHKTLLELTAYDAKARSTTRRITVNLLVPKPLPPPVTNGTDGPPPTDQATGGNPANPPPTNTGQTTGGPATTTATTAGGR